VTLKEMYNFLWPKNSNDRELGVLIEYARNVINFYFFPFIFNFICSILLLQLVSILVTAKK
jgi:hypothetical protein